MRQGPEGRRWLLATAAVVAACWLLAGARDAALERAGRLEADLDRLAGLAAEYQRLSGDPVDPAADPASPRLPLGIVVDRTARRALRHGTVLSLAPWAGGTSDSPAQIRDGTALTTDEPVELRLSEAPLTDLVDLLYALDHAPRRLRVDRLHVRRSRAEPAAGTDGTALEVTAVVALR